MLESIIGILAAISIAVSAGLAVAVARLHKRSQQLQHAVQALQQDTDTRKLQASNDNPDMYPALAGLRFALAITQDHAIPTLSLLLKDALVACDADVTLISPEQALLITDSWGKGSLDDQPDVLVWGSITCNGYSEFYYKAMLSYLTPYGLLNPTSELPAQGNPQSSLVVTIVSKLKKELIIAQRRLERGRAIQELRHEGMLRQIEQ